MKIMYQIALVFLICWVGQIVEALLPFPFPASVIAMVLLFLLLCSGAVKIGHIREKSDFLLSNMAFFFVPAGVSIMNYFELLKSSAVQLVLICLITTVITFAATAYSVKLTMRLLERRKRRV